MRGQRGFFGHPQRGPGRNTRFSGYQRDARADPAYNLTTMNEIKSESAKLDATLMRLQKEVQDLEMQRNMQLQQDSTSQDLFLRWSGISIDVATERECVVNFLPSNEHDKSYQIGFQRIGQYWSVSFKNLPYCMTTVPQRVAELKIESIDALGLCVHTIQTEIDLSNRRAKQFAEAMTLSSPTLRIYPAVSTTTVLLELLVSDTIGSNLNRTSIYLTYLTEKYLPEEPLFKFKGGDESAQSEFKKQLACLQYMPLKDALQCAFDQDDTSKQDSHSETNKEISEESKSSTLPVSERESSVSQTKKIRQTKIQGKSPTKFKKPGPKSKKVK